MFESILNNPGIFEITIIMIVLIVVALWQKLKQAAAAIGGIYIIYLFFIVWASDSSNEIKSENIQKELGEFQEDFDTIGFVKDALTEVLENNEPEPITPEEEKVLIPKKNSALIVFNEIEIDLIEENPKKGGSTPISNLENTIKVISFQLGRNLVNRELVDIDSVFSVEDERVYFMTKIENMNDSKIVYHKWYHGDILRSKVKMEIGWSYSWRTWSYISVSPNRYGNWKVVVEDSLGTRYDSLSFNILNDLNN